MKKVLLTLVLMLAGMTAGAQETNDTVKADTVKTEKKSVVINTNFNMAGDAILLSKSAHVSRSDFKPLKWELTNEVVGGKNFITLKVINKKTGQQEEFKTWNEGVSMMMEKTKDTTIYSVYDETFIHLRILEMPQGNSILLFSALRTK